MTKQQQTLLANYRRADKTSVCEAYKNPSFYKTRAEHFILEEMKANNGHDYYVTTYGCQHFSCAYLYEKDNQQRLRYHTAYNVYDFAI